MQHHGRYDWVPQPPLSHMLPRPTITAVYTHRWLLCLRSGPPPPPPLCHLLPTLRSKCRNVEHSKSLSLLQTLVTNPFRYYWNALRDSRRGGSLTRFMRGLGHSWGVRRTPGGCSTTGMVWIDSVLRCEGATAFVEGPGFALIGFWLNPQQLKPC